MLLAEVPGVARKNSILHSSVELKNLIRLNFSNFRTSSFELLNYSNSLSLLMLYDHSPCCLAVRPYHIHLSFVLLCGLVGHSNSHPSRVTPRRAISRVDPARRATPSC